MSSEIEDSAEPVNPCVTGDTREPLAKVFETLEVMRREIGGLQTLATSQRRPWYRDVSTLIAVLALIFSFGTTAVSYRRTETQDIQNARQELRGLLQRLSAIPRENFEAGNKYKDDQNARASLSQLYAQENAILVRQAAEIAQRLPPSVVSATEYYSIAVAFQAANNLQGARQFLQLARDHATEFNDEIAAIRSSAALEYIVGAPGAGRKGFQDALDIFSKYKFDPFTVSYTNAFTEIQWASSEAGIGNFSVANGHLDDAGQIAQGMPYSPGAEGLKQQIAQMRALIAHGMPPGVAQPAAPVAVSPTIGKP